MIKTNKKEITNNILERNLSEFHYDFNQNIDLLTSEIRDNSFLIIGGGGSIGSSVVEKLFIMNAKKIHVIDNNENNLVEIVRNVRSQNIENKGFFLTSCLDINNPMFVSFLKNNKFDYILNFAAMKHVRSERDIYSLTQLIQTNVIAINKIIKNLNKMNIKGFLNVSTDKATNPSNLMGASKLAAEELLLSNRGSFKIVMARFANVALSKGSLIDSFIYRVNKNQPLSVPQDIRRYFISHEEAAELCIIACILGKNNDIFIPNSDKILTAKSFVQIAKKFLHTIKLQPKIFQNEIEAKKSFNYINKEKFWPCYFFNSDTSGEKKIESFYTKNDIVDTTSFHSIGIIKKKPNINNKEIKLLIKELTNLTENFNLDKKEIVNIFSKHIKSFKHIDKGKSLDERM